MKSVKMMRNMVYGARAIDSVVEFSCTRISSPSTTVLCARTMHAYRQISGSSVITKSRINNLHVIYNVSGKMKVFELQKRYRTRQLCELKRITSTLVRVSLKGYVIGIFFCFFFLFSVSLCREPSLPGHALHQIVVVKEVFNGHAYDPIMEPD